MSRKTIITIAAVVLAAVSALVLTADEQSTICQALCSSGE